MPILSYVIVAVAAYLLGSIPTGFLAARAKGIDIRTVGSGNIGATNAMRALGKPLGIFVLLMDGLKGWLACWFGKWFCIWYVCHFSLFTTVGLDEQTLESLIPIVQCEIVAGIFAVLGHNFPCWLQIQRRQRHRHQRRRLSGARAVGLADCVVVFLLALLATRYVSVGSISAAIALPAAVWILPPHNLLLGVVTTALGVLAIYKHKGNIRRLVAGTENRLQFKKKETT